MLNLIVSQWIIKINGLKCLFSFYITINGSFELVDRNSLSCVDPNSKRKRK